MLIVTDMSKRKLILLVLFFGVVVMLLFYSNIAVQDVMHVKPKLLEGTSTFDSSEDDDFNFEKESSVKYSLTTTSPDEISFKDSNFVNGGKRMNHTKLKSLDMTDNFNDLKISMAEIKKKLTGDLNILPHPRQFENIKMISIPPENSLSRISLPNAPTKSSPITKEERDNVDDEVMSPKPNIKPKEDMVPERSEGTPLPNSRKIKYLPRDKPIMIHDSTGKSFHAKDYKNENHFETSMNQKVDDSVGKDIRMNSGKTRHKILLLATGRSGSSFIGDLFNHHRDVMYFFEPMHGAQIVYRYYQKHVLKDASELHKRTVDYFKDLFDCNVRVQHQVLIRYYGKLSDRSKSAALNKPPFCSPGQNCVKKLLTRSEIYNECHEKYSHTVIKELLGRFPFNLNGFIRDTDQPVKVIHLVRDPRAIFMSWVFAGWLHRRDPRALLTDSCEKTIKNVRYGNSELKPKGLFKVVRYEDVCMNFNAEVRSLLDFSGLDVYPEYESYMEQVSGVKNITRKRTLHFIYSTERDIREQVDNWRARIRIENLQLVESICGELMSMFGYRKVVNNMELLYNTKIPLY